MISDTQNLPIAHELTDGELDLVSAGASNNVGSFIRFVEGLTLTACEACWRVISDHY